jgi:predicted exporter
LPIVLALAGAALFAAAVFSHVSLRTDLAEFLPQGQTAAARFMLRELRSSAATSLIMIGIEGAPSDALARISRGMTASLTSSDLFALVDDGGGEVIGSPEQQFLFSRRYLLSPVTTPAAFEVAALHADMAQLLQQLQSSGSPLVQLFGLADPPGAFLALVKEWLGGSRVRSLHGVWFAADHDRALILAKTTAGGMDVPAQEQVAAAIRAAFSAADPGGARLLASGTAIFTRDAAATIRGDVERISILSALLTGLLLLWRFRSVWVIAAIAVPVVISIAAAALIVQLVFGFVHGIAFGFGMTMLGVTLDYPVLLIGHRKQGEAVSGTLRRIGQAFLLAVVTAALGLTGMLFAGFPGLQQLAVFSVVGILVAALATRLLLAPLIVAADLAPVAAGDPARLLWIERLRSYRMWGVVVVAAAFGYLLVIGGPRWENDLVHLSPVPRSALALDSELRGELGAPDAGQIGIVRGGTVDDVLRQEEAILPVLDRLRRVGAIGGAEIAARYLPSVAMQRARQAALPIDLAERVAAARQGLPFRADAFQPFIDDVAAARTMQPVMLADITSKVIAARLEPLLFQRDGTWFGVIAPTDARAPPAVAAALREAGVFYVDMGAEANAIVTSYTGAALRWLAIGGAAAVVVLLIGLRDPLRVMRVVAAIAAALVVTVALLTLARVRISLLHIASLQFVAGVGLDYALFFARRQLDIEERARTLRTLATCNAMAVLTFGLLALCRTPLLQQIGITVVIGAVMAMLFGFLFAGPRIDRPRELA